MIQAPVSNYGMAQAAQPTQPKGPVYSPKYSAVSIEFAGPPTLNAPPAMPYYMPPNMTTPPQQMPAVEPQAPQQNPVPAPMLDGAPVNVQPATNEGPGSIAEKAFRGLCSNDLDEQALVMEDIAKKGISQDGSPVDYNQLVPYVQENIVDRLSEIMNVDSSNLPGPTEAQQELRNKVIANEQAKIQAQAKGQDPNSAKLPFELTDDQVALAKSLSPFEKVERNKEYALFTTAILQKTYINAIEKAGDPVPPITELPGSRAIISHLKGDPNPDIQVAAIDALRYVSEGRPEYKNDLSTMYQIATTDKSPSVAEAAKQALADLG